MRPTSTPWRMALRISAVLTVVALTTTGVPAVAAKRPEFVRAEGTELTFRGQPYRFAGMNIYNANSDGTCGYAFTGRSLRKSLRQIGPGQNAIRAWFFQNLATTPDGARDWKAFDRTIRQAKRSGAKVIAVLGNQWADCEGWPTYEAGYKNESWYEEGYATGPGSPGMPSTYRDWVEEVVARYRKDPGVLMWQLMNEAEAKTSVDGTCEPTAAGSLRLFAEDMATRVKSIDANHLLSLGTIGSGQCGASHTEYKDLHAVEGIDLCEIHDYTHEAMPGDKFNGVAFRVEQCGELDKPLFLGETGVKPSELPGDLTDRAGLFAAKFDAQVGAGLVGTMLWAWIDAAHGGSKLDDYDIGPNDPALATLDDVSCQGRRRNACP